MQFDSGPGHGKHVSRGVVTPNPAGNRSHCACSTSVWLNSEYAGQYSEKPNESGMRQVYHGLPFREHSVETVRRFELSSGGVDLLSSLPSPLGLMAVSSESSEPYSGIRITATRAADVSTSTLASVGKRMIIISAVLSN